MHFLTLFILSLILLAPVKIHAETVTLSDGRTVELRPDGTYSFLKAKIPTMTAECQADVYCRREFSIQWIYQLKIAKPNISTNNLIWENNFKTFLANFFPSTHGIYLGMSKKDEKLSFAEHLREVLGGPPNEVQLFGDQYLVFHACRHQSCDEKGFVWIDVKGGTVVAAIRHFSFEDENFDNAGQLLVSGTAINYKQLPCEFTDALVGWMNSLGIKTFSKLRYVDDEWAESVDKKGLPVFVPRVETC